LGNHKEYLWAGAAIIWGMGEDEPKQERRGQDHEEPHGKQRARLKYYFIVSELESHGLAGTKPLMT
jgi:hypothetical protein